MKIITPIFKIQDIDKINANVDGFILSNEKFGARLTSSFSLEQLIVAIGKIKGLKKEVFININQLYTNDQIDLLMTFVLKLPIKDITGFICADIGVLEAFKKIELVNMIIYNPETLLTNYFDFNYLKKDNVFGAFVAKEITLDDIKIIASKKQIKTFMIGHGHLDMFYSKRQLLKNYANYLGIEETFHNQRNLALKEEIRPNEKYPILEDYAGTHVFRDTVFSSLKYLDQLKNLIDYLVIDPIFKDLAYLDQITSLYNKNQLNSKEINYIQEKYHEKWDDGFLFTKTIYKRS